MTGMQPLSPPQQPKQGAAVKADRACSLLHLRPPVAFKRFKRLLSARLLVLHTKLVSLRRNGLLYHRASEVLLSFYELSPALYGFFFFFCKCLIRACSGHVQTCLYIHSHQEILSLYPVV